MCENNLAETYSKSSTCLLKRYDFYFVATNMQKQSWGKSPVKTKAFSLALS